MNWISVKDRLPEKDGQYLIYYNDDGFRGVWIDNFAVNLSNVSYCFKGKNRSGWFSYELDYSGQYNYEETTSVTHWMPLPEPPKGA